jgi:enamine deaminase RidA (YjgF/YER057c/UK114 family)
VRWAPNYSLSRKTGAATHFALNDVYARYFPKNSPARVFACVAAWPGRFDIEIATA